MNRLIDNILTAFFVFAFVTIVPVTYAAVNVATRPDMITMVLELPPPGKPVLIVYDVINPKPGKLLDPPKDFPIYYEWKTSGIEDFTTYIDIRDNYPEMLEYFADAAYSETTHINSRAYTEEEVLCMAQNIYFEARNETLKGMIAVALVTLERVDDPRYPSDVCSVVYDSKQFSWYWDGLPDRPKNTRAYEKVRMVADAVMASDTALYDFTYGSTHYHADYVEPYWKDYMVFKAKIDTHLFYYEPPRTLTAKL